MSSFGPWFCFCPFSCGKTVSLVFCASPDDRCSLRWEWRCPPWHLDCEPAQSKASRCSSAAGSDRPLGPGSAWRRSSQNRAPAPPRSASASISHRYCSGWFGCATSRRPAAIPALRCPGSTG
uniref:(northern house mosquito) hypothetical protein n=1 Tax=Culex pipiens TaxID=7175 RepID=A0A8D8D097_CULPI